MSLIEELTERANEITQCWYENWQRSRHPHPEIGEAALKDMLPEQLRLIGEQLRHGRKGENAEDLWQPAMRLDPEQRVLQKIPIEEVVQEYRIAVETVRDWIEKKGISVELWEYSYFYSAMFELVAESVRRYAAFESDRVAKDRAEYLAALTHQMRNPLTSMQLQLEAFARTADPEAQKRILERFKRGMTRLLFLVNGVMRLERFKPEEIPVHIQNVQPVRLIQQVMDENEEEALRKGVGLEFHVSHTLRISMDPELFLDALGNLVQNAVKYSDSGVIRVESHEEDKTVLFRVTDSGPGISDERQKALFQPIEPGKGRGIGLGLTIAKRAVQAQQGEIGVQSEIGKGSSFWFRIPKNVRGRDEESKGKDVA